MAERSVWMPLIKGKDVKAERDPACGSMAKVYPVGGPYQDLCSWVTVTRTLAEDEKWRYQSHMHPDMTEYWFVLDGKGQVTVGTETYDVEPGDLVITPPLTPHSASGDVTILGVIAKYNKDGKTYGGKIPIVPTEAPYRDDPEKLPKPWKYYEIEHKV